MNESDESGFDSAVPFFAALCLFLSAVEYAVPKPLPFMRLGLANLPIIVSLAVLRKRDVVLLILLKILGQALISGTFFSYVFVFSAAGSAASGLAMLGLYTLLHKRNAVSNAGLSVAGAFANNCAQVAVARVMVFGQSAAYIAPVLFATGLATGLVLGVFANAFCGRSVWYRKITEEAAAERGALSAPKHRPVYARADRQGAVPVSAGIQFIAAMLAFPVFLLQKNTVVVWTCTAVFCAAAAVKKHGKIKILPSVFMTLCVTFFSLLSPYGKVLFSLGSFHVTLDALTGGLHKSGILTGMVFLSQFAISPRMYFPGRTGRFLGSMFTTFDELTSRRISFRRGHVIEALDVRLSELWG
jgi:Predicted membrane protein